MNNINKATIKKVAVLGSTGSIGRQTLDVIRENPDRLKAVSLTAHTNAKLLAEQKREFQAEFAGCGRGALLEAVRKGADIVVVATAGIAALEAVLEAIDLGIDIAIANKESIIAGGNLIDAAMKHSASRLIPLDSEHSAIFQCLVNSFTAPEKLILTASGGPFFGYSRAELDKVTPQASLHHPKWSMGKKITVDSATMMNKGFEIIEAARLFAVTEDKIDVLVHPQSVVHSMVEFADGTVAANMSLPDMRIPIQYALTFPERTLAPRPRLNLAELQLLEFFSPDNEVFPTMEFARRALRKGGCLTLALCAADEVCVKAFLEEKLPFTGIFEILERVLNCYDAPAPGSFAEVEAVFCEVMRFTESLHKQYIDTVKK